MRKDFLSRLLRFLVWAAAIITMSLLILLVGYILINGIPHLKASLFDLNYTSDNVSMLPSIINTVLMTIISLLIAAPIGICSAIYLVEYAKRGLLSGAFTMAIMILPLIMRTTEEALKSVPDSYREGSFGLGAGRLRTIFRVVLPSAVPGILSGVILAIGRVVGETAALMFTAGTVAKLPKSILSSTRTLSVHMYTLANEGLHVDEAYATAVVLLVIVILINGLSSLVAKRLGKGE